MDKATSYGALVIALATAAVVATKTDKLVSATVSEDDTAVTAVLKSQADLRTVTCVRGWVQLKVADGLTLHWTCDGAYQPTWETWLNKKAGADGMAITFDPKDLGSAVTVGVRVQKGAEPPRPMTIAQALGEKAEK